jgi:hypothetical protein
VFGLAAPNMNHQESVFVLLSTLTRPETSPDVFIYALAFGQLREFEVRKQYLAHLKNHPELTAEWRRTAQRYRTKYPLATAEMLDSLEIANRSESVADDGSFETRLRERVSRYMPLVRERKQINSNVRLGLFTVRNAILGIKTSTKRPMVRQRYDMNREFLGLLVDLGRERGVKVLLYVAPFNPLAENPYIPEEYEAFKEWLYAFGRETATPVTNLENVVPSADWGLFLGGPDFGHFRGEGHEKTAAALLKEFAAYLAPPSQPGAPRS